MSPAQGHVAPRHPDRRRAGRAAAVESARTQAAPTPRFGLESDRLSLRTGAARACADPYFGADRAATAPAATSGWSFSAITCSASSSPTCCFAPSRRPTRANCRAGWPTSCARRPAPRWRARSTSARRSGSAHRKRNAGGRARTAILADVCEALIGAVFLDGGYEAAAALIERFWSERMRAPARPLRDPKTVLQEWAQARGLPTPAYREVERTRPAPRSGVPRHRRAAGSRARPKGIGRSKRAAEQAAAAAMLTREGVDGGPALDG